ncbi:MAG: GNAT family N-acetyltransferase [Candidatus Babeliales bacterium]|jgi:ribosomal protein S18 acetylase RimI-like enzyme
MRQRVRNLFLFFIAANVLYLTSVAQEVELDELKTHFFTSEEDVLQLYQLMKDTHEILQFKNITYWAIAGTLLGAVRHQGIIPWDNDLDICIDKKQNSDFILTKPLFERLGYSVQSWTDRVGHRICKKDKNKILIHMDIVVHEEATDYFYYRWKRQGIFQQERIKGNDLFPLKDYIFGNISIKGPNNPFNYLTSCYGADCLEVALIRDRGKKNGEIKKISLKDELKYPAMPIGPLQDRTFELVSDEVLSPKIFTISLQNDGQIESIARKIKPVFIAAFEKQAKNQFKKEHPKEYQVLHRSNKTINDLLQTRFLNIIEALKQQRGDIKNVSVITIESNNAKNIIGYLLFVEASINQILQSMIKRKYISSIVSLPQDILLAQDIQDSTNKTVYILSLAVHPKFQKRGFCKKLISYLLEQCPNIKKVYLLSAASKVNVSVQKIYEHLGFVGIGELITSDQNAKNLYLLDTNQYPNNRMCKLFV